jgi:hypothetical protein
MKNNVEDFLECFTIFFMIYFNTLQSHLNVQNTSMLKKKLCSIAHNTLKSVQLVPCL